MPKYRRKKKNQSAHQPLALMADGVTQFQIAPSVHTSVPQSQYVVSHGQATAITIIMLVVAGVVMIVIALLVTKCCLWRKKRSSNSTTTLTSTDLEAGTIERFLDEFLKDKPMRFSPRQLIELTRDYSETLGSGGFGVVYKGQLPNGLQVAVKVLRGNLDKSAEKQFMAEVGTIGRTYHLNLVKLYGFCFDVTVKALVYEYMENGSLDRHLFDTNSEMKWEGLYDVAIGTAKGIRYLHEECQQKIVHYDIKPGNVLLSANFSPKVADFGLAKFCDRENTHISITGGRGTPGYAAPELWTPFPVTHKCDVYSFGMLLFEILGRRRNLESGQADTRQWFPRWVWENFEQGQLESIMSCCGIEESNREKACRVCKVAFWCVQYQPESRPSMSSVARMLEGDEEIVQPANPFMYMMALDAGSGAWSGNTSFAASSYRGSGAWSKNNTSSSTSKDTGQKLSEVTSS